MLTILKGGIELPFKSFTFPGGEIGVKLDTSLHRYLYALAKHQTIVARLQSSADVMELAMVRDALARFDPTPIRLALLYVPYGRQDRVCVPGESFSLKVFASLINAMGFERVTVFDPHSDVTGALFERVYIVEQLVILGAFDKLNARLQPPLATRPVFVSPDAGANKKTAALAAHYGHVHFIRADKLRDLSTGRIKEIVVVNPREEVEGQDCVIVDDLCDAGGTFIGLAKALRDKGAKTVDLYVTHGLFTKGLAPLLDGGIDHVYTTDTYHHSFGHLEGGLSVGRFTALKLGDVFPL